MRLLSGMTIVLMLATSRAWPQQASPIPVSKQQQDRLGIALHDVMSAESITVVDRIRRMRRAPSTDVKIGNAHISISIRDYASASSTLVQAQNEMCVADSALAKQTQPLANGLASRSAVSLTRPSTLCGTATARRARPFC